MKRKLKAGFFDLGFTDEYKIILENNAASLPVSPPWPQVLPGGAQTPTSPRVSRAVSGSSRASAQRAKTVLLGRTLQSPPQQYAKSAPLLMGQDIPLVRDKQDAIHVYKVTLGTIRPATRVLR